MKYKINPAILHQAKMLGEIEKMRKMIGGSITPSKSYTETQTSYRQQDGTDMFDRQFGSGWREEPDYREGFKKHYEGRFN